MQRAVVRCDVRFGFSVVRDYRGANCGGQLKCGNGFARCRVDGGKHASVVAVQQNVANLASAAPVEARVCLFVCPNPFAGDGVNAEERARCGVVVRVKRIGGAGEHHAARGGYGGNALSARCDGARYPKRFHLARRYALQTAVGKGNDDNAVGVRHAAGGSINGAEQLKRCGFLALGV